MHAPRSAPVNRPTPHTIADWVAERIRDDIRTGALKPGQRLLQEEVARSLDVSTTPVREAFAILKSEGIVKGDRHRGAIVFSPTLEDVIEINDIRDALERLAVTKAMPCYGPAVRRQIKAHLDEMLAGKDTAQYGDLHRAFHRAIFTPSGSARLVGLITELREPMTVVPAGMIPEWSRREALEDKEHRQLYRAIAQGDQDRLLQLLYIHRGAADIDAARTV